MAMIHLALNLFFCHVWFEIHYLLIKEMYCQLLYRKIFFMNWKFHQISSSFCWTNVTTIEILCNLIHFSYFCSSTIKAFVDIFMNVFNGSNRSATLNVNVCMVFAKQICIMRNHSLTSNSVWLSIIQWMWNIISYAIILTTIQRISIITNDSLWLKWLWKTFAALLTVCHRVQCHTFSFRVQLTARSMYHDRSYHIH